MSTFRKSVNFPRYRSPLGILTGALLVVASSTGWFLVGDAGAATTPATVNLNSSGAFAILAGSTITNTGSSVVAGDIGLSPGTSITGFPPGTQSTGTTHVADATAVTAQSDLAAAFTDASTRTPATIEPSNFGGLTLGAGIYSVPSSLSITGTLTLNGANDASSVFIIQVPSTLTTATSSSVVLENGAQACNVFWAIGSSATLGTSSSMAGTIMALTSITLDTSAQVSGRVLARTGAVTLDSNSVTVPACAQSSTPTTTTTVASTTTTTVAPTTTTTVPVVVTPPTTPPSASSPAPVIPLGAPQTGFGGMAGGSSLLGPLLALAGLAALVGVAVTGTVLRRRYATAHDTGEDDHRSES